VPLSLLPVKADDESVRTPPSGLRQGYHQRGSRTVSAAVIRPGFRIAPDLAPGTYTITRERRTSLLVIAGLLVGRSPRRPRLWWSRPMPADVCSDAPVRAGSIRHPQRVADTGDRTKWQLPAS
jgi:hypothetical protein